MYRIERRWREKNVVVLVSLFRGQAGKILSLVYGQYVQLNHEFMGVFFTLKQNQTS